MHPYSLLLGGLLATFRSATLRLLSKPSAAEPPPCPRPERCVIRRCAPTSVVSSFYNIGRHLTQVVRKLKWNTLAHLRGQGELFGARASHVGCPSGRGLAEAKGACALARTG